jgi:dTDP-glucose 4,6-dehydratase
MRTLITGGAGFLGSHLCAALIARGDEVVCVDNLSTGAKSNLLPLAGLPRFEFVEADITAEIPAPGHIDAVAHLASPASPRDYLRLPLQTLAAGSRGTEHALRLADEYHARFVLASTSEIYGDPAVHPQPEGYWGNVNPVGLRSVYDEAKRFAEALTVAWRREHGLNTGIIRIFNTYGPQMAASDGRVITTFIGQALAGEPLTVFGDGSQTRSLCYVDDLIRGLIAMIDCAVPGPVNLGNPEERSIIDIASLVLKVTKSDSPIRYLPLPVDDPARRRPDIALARRLIGWQPRIPLADGLQITTDWLRSRIAS